MHRSSLVRLALAAAVLLLSVEGAAEPRPAVIVTPGSARTFRAAIQRFADANDGRAEAFRRVLGESLEYSSVFDAVDPKAFLGPEVTVALDGGLPPVCSDWTQIGADVLVEGEIQVGGPDLRVEFRAWDTSRCTRLVRKRYQQPLKDDPNVLARRIADDIVAAFVGVRGVSSTELAFISSRGGNPEVYVMGADGANARAATANRSINAFPAWTPSGDSILYTSYRDGNRPQLFLSSRGRGRPGRPLASIGRSKAQYRGVFDPAGNMLAAVLSDEGAAEIYTARSNGSNIKQLTRNRAIDISPSWSPDGERIAFVSDRTGAPQVYIMDANGQNQRRLTYQGTYNTSPAWSPDGQWIAYETRLGGQFDIWLIDPEGKINAPLIDHPRSDESPSWAPNSRKLAFSSNRRGRKDIYVVDLSGDHLRRLTEDAGDNTSPAWGPFPR